jgi:hypothetical protein
MIFDAIRETEHNLQRTVMQRPSPDLHSSALIGNVVKHIPEIRKDATILLDATATTPAAMLDRLHAAMKHWCHLIQNYASSAGCQYWPCTWRRHDDIEGKVANTPLLTTSLLR